MIVKSIVIHNIPYKILCDTSAENHLEELSQKLDERVKKISSNLAQRPSDATLLLLAGLQLEDELLEIHNKLRELEKYSSFTELIEYVEGRMKKLLHDIQNIHE